MDYLIRNGKVIDGTGSPWYKADVGIENGRIVYIGTGDGIEADCYIDAKNKIVAPGFIDVHAHYDFAPFVSNSMEEKLLQGVTSIIVGLCGYSIAPVSVKNAQLLDKYVSFMKSGAQVDYGWETVGRYLETVEHLGVGTNFAMLVGHGTLRIDSMGFEERRPSKPEMNQMIERLNEAMDQGAFGLSTGLFYAPGSYADIQELTELASVLGKYGGIYVTHMRSESENLFEAVDETIKIAGKAGVPAHIHHMKCMGMHNWGKSEIYMQKIKNARDNGLDITGDQYPYTFGATTLRGLLPGWAQEGGVEKLFERLADKNTRNRIIYELENDESWANAYLKDCIPEGITVVYAPSTPEFTGKSLLQISDEINCSPTEALLHIVCRNDGMDTACLELMCEQDLEYIMKQPFVMIGSDSNQPAHGALCHPRTYGTFSRVLYRYCIQKSILTLEEGIQKMTSLPAARYGLSHKGLIKVGMDADINVFDPVKLRDKASLQEPLQYAEGMDTVMVNGIPVVESGCYNGKKVGKVLRKCHHFQ